MQKITSTGANGVECWYTKSTNICIRETEKGSISSKGSAYCGSANIAPGILRKLLDSENVKILRKLLDLPQKDKEAMIAAADEKRQSREVDTAVGIVRDMVALMRRGLVTRAQVETAAAAQSDACPAAAEAITALMAAL